MNISNSIIIGGISSASKNATIIGTKINYWKKSRQTQHPDVSK